MKKLNRYHRGVYFPAWAEESLERFLSGIKSKNSLVFTTHALEKILTYNVKYGTQLWKYLLKSLRKLSVDTSSVFEFYSFEKDVRKVCMRFSFDEFPVDLVLVVSADNTVITVFTINKGDNHGSLDIELYEKGQEL